MKHSIPMLALFACLAAEIPAPGALSHWDSNGSVPGAGATPNGGWDTNTFWSADPTGSSSTAPWVNGDTAVFSAGADAVNAFSVTLDGPISAGGITFEEGLPTITGGSITMTNDFEFPIIVTNVAIINSDLQDQTGNCGFKKTGPGLLKLGGAGTFNGGVDIVAGGTVSITSASALGSSLASTIVSNGASLQVTNNIACSESVILNGFGVNNNGALYGYNGTSGKNSPWSGGAVIHSDARINHNGTGGSWWYWSTTPIQTNGVNNADLYIGGTGNSLRLDINAFYPDAVNHRPCIDIGDGVLYKDGTSELRLEVATVAREVHFNGGHILARCGPGTNFCYRTVSPGMFVCNEGAAWLSGDFTPATIYVGAGAGQFRNGSGGPSQTWEHPIVLASGANPVFRVQNTLSFICNGEISGAGGLSKFNDTGTLYLNGTNTYSGSTIINGGTLTLGANGSISNSAVISVRASGIFNVTSNSAGFTLQSAQTLQGTGIVWGDVTTDGTLAPGVPGSSPIGTLSFSNNLTVAGNLTIEVDRTASPSSDLIVAEGTLTNAGTGTLTVTNIAWAALQPNDSFQIFNKPLLNGNALLVASAGGVTWSNKLAIDGSIQVLSAPAPVAATNVAIQTVGPTSFLLSGSGAPNSIYGILTSTNVETPMSSWSFLGTAVANGSGLIQFTDTQATNTQQFYRFGQ